MPRYGGSWSGAQHANVTRPLSKLIACITNYRLASLDSGSGGGLGRSGDSWCVIRYMSYVNWANLALVGFSGLSLPLAWLGSGFVYTSTLSSAKALPFFRCVITSVWDVSPTFIPAILASTTMTSATTATTTTYEIDCLLKIVRQVRSSLTCCLAAANSGALMRSSRSQTFLDSRTGSLNLESSK